MKDISQRMKNFLIGLGVFILLVLFFYLTKINGYSILRIYLIGFWGYIIFSDITNSKNTKVSRETYDDPTIIELFQYCGIWRLVKYITQSLGFTLLLIGFNVLKNIPFFMIAGTLLVGISLLFDSLYINDTKKIRELQAKEARR